jgi:hypothetical protein
MHGQIHSSGYQLPEASPPLALTIEAQPEFAAEYRMTNTPERACQAQRFYGRLMAQNLRILFDHARQGQVVKRALDAYEAALHEKARARSAQTSRGDA